MKSMSKKNRSDVLRDGIKKHKASKDKEEEPKEPIKASCIKEMTDVDRFNALQDRADRLSNHFHSKRSAEQIASREIH